jgi:hypothetical protein
MGNQISWSHFLAREKQPTSTNDTILVHVFCCIAYMPSSFPIGLSSIVYPSFFEIYILYNPVNAAVVRERHEIIKTQSQRLIFNSNKFFILLSIFFFKCVFYWKCWRIWNSNRGRVYRKSIKGPTIGYV